MCIPEDSHFVYHSPLICLPSPLAMDDSAVDKALTNIPPSGSLL